MQRSNAQRGSPRGLDERQAGPDAPRATVRPQGHFLGAANDGNNLAVVVSVVVVLLDCPVWRAFRNRLPQPVFGVIDFRHRGVIGSADEASRLVSCAVDAFLPVFAVIEKFLHVIERGDCFRCRKSRTGGAASVEKARAHDFFSSLPRLGYRRMRAGRGTEHEVAAKTVDDPFRQNSEGNRR
jgi:hypothetical protein